MVLDDDLTLERTHPDLVTLFLHVVQGGNLEDITINEENEELWMLVNKHIDIGQHNFLLGFWRLKWKAYQKQYA